MAKYKTYKERGLPGVQDREVRAVYCARIDGVHTVAEYLRLVRGRKLPPLQYKSLSVPTVPCRRCTSLRPDDGAKCEFCGVYQHCAIVTQVAGQPAAKVASHPAVIPSTGIVKPVNPRRRRSK